MTASDQKEPGNHEVSTDTTKQAPKPIEGYPERRLISDRPSPETFDRQAARAILEKRVPVNCAVEVDRGKMTLTMSDGYRTGLMHYHFLAGGTPPYAKMAAAGIHLHVTRDNALREEGFDAEALEDSILEVLAADPQAYVMIGVSAKWWHVNEYLTGGFSLGDVAYRDKIAQTLRRMGEYLRTHDIGKVVVGTHLDGAGDGQFYYMWPISPETKLETPAETTGFREWLREKYRNDPEKLCAAWGDPAVTFDTATMADNVTGGFEFSTHSQDQPGTNDEQRIWLREDVGKEKHRLDTRQFVYAMSPVRLLQAWSKAFKEGIGKPVSVSAWRPDSATGMVGNVHGGSALMEGEGKLETRVGVCEYAGLRETDKPGLGHSTWSSAAIRGVLSMRELDNRPPGENVVNVGSPTAEEGYAGFQAQIRRDLGAAATRGQAAWFFEMGTWYSQEDTWPALEEGARVMAWAHRKEAPSAIKEMAVFVDEEAGWRVCGNWPLYDAHFHARATLNQSGVPYDLYFLDDLRHPKLPDYKVYVLLISATLNAKQLAAIQQRVQQAGKTLVVQAAYAQPGIGSPDFYSRTPWLEQTLRQGPHNTHWLTEAFTPTCIHDIATQAGLATLGTPGQVTHVGAGVAVVHRLQPGPATVRFGQPVDLIELDGKTVRTANVRQWEPQCDLRRADIIFYRPTEALSH